MTTLPSPCFAKTNIKPVPAVETHVTKENIKTTNFVAYCKYCREGFSSQNDLFHHRKSHERCPYEECKFNASGKVVAEHIQRVHMKTNALVKIQDLITPEQIEKWREERRKRYPTTANVTLRQQAQEIRFQRGEKLQDRQQRFGDLQQRDHFKNMDNRTRHHQGVKRNRLNNQEYPRRGGRHRQRLTDEYKAEEIKPVEEKQETTTLSGTTKSKDSQKPPPIRAKVLHPTVDESSDDEIRATPSFKGTCQMKGYHDVETILKEKAALSILGIYGSGSDSENETDVEEPLDKKPVSLLTHYELPAQPQAESTTKQNNEISKEVINDNSIVNPQEIDEGDAPDEIPITHINGMLPREAEASISADKVSRKRKRDHHVDRGDFRMRPKQGLDYSRLRYKPSVNPFLEKLLREDIRHERNVLLQCVNFVVRNNFFGVGQTVSESEEKDPSNIKIEL